MAEDLDEKPCSALEALGDHRADSVDMVALQDAFPQIFETFVGMGEYHILSSLESAGFDEERAIRNLKAKIRQSKVLGINLKAATRIEQQQFIEKRESVVKVCARPLPPHPLPPCPHHTRACARNICYILYRSGA